MRARKHTSLSDPALIHTFSELVTRDHGDTADLLACVSEVDARRLYLPAGYPSMFTYCVHAFHMSEDVAYKRIRAARVARRFPAIYGAVAEGRLHLSAVVLLAPHLTAAIAGDLLQAATHRTKSEIEELLARRFPRPDLPAMVRALKSSVAGPDQTSLETIEASNTEPARSPTAQPAPGPVEAPLAAAISEDSPFAGEATGNEPAPATIFGNQLAPGSVGASFLRTKLTPLAPGRFGVQFTMDQETHELLAHVQALLGQRVASEDISEVFKRALHVLERQLEREKFAATDMPRPRRRRLRSNPQHIPAQVKREVWKRVGGRCTFMGANGHRCGARKFLEFDHIQPVARGGEATISGIRLRCRMHNQYEAERAFGAEFMQAKREAGRREATQRGARRDCATAAGGNLGAT